MEPPKVGAQYKTIEMNTDYKFKPDEVYQLMKSQK